jgi:hypothetical protein
MTGFEIVAIISVITVFAWFIMAAKNTNSRNRFIEEDDTKKKE